MYKELKPIAIKTISIDEDQERTVARIHSLIGVAFS